MRYEHVYKYKSNNSATNIGDGPHLLKNNNNEAPALYRVLVCDGHVFLFHNICKEPTYYRLEQVEEFIRDGRWIYIKPLSVKITWEEPR